VGGNTEAFTVINRCPTSGRVQAQEVRASMMAMAAGLSTKVAINGFGRIVRNVLRCWLGRKDKPFDIVAINAGSMDPKTTRHLLMHDTVLGNLKNDVKITDDGLTIDGKAIKLLTGRDPAAMPWKDLDVEVIIESTGAFNSLDGGSKHIEAGAKKVVLTAPGKNCPTYVVGVNEGDYDAANDTVVSNASCTTNGMASVCKVLDESFGVQYGMMTTTHSYTGDQMILDGRHRDLRRARAGACNIVPTSTGAAKAVAAVLHPVGRHGNSDTIRKQGVVDRLVSGRSPPVAHFSEKYLEKMIRTNSAFKEREADLRTARSTALGETPKLGQNVAGPAILVGA